jgi:hypothetical protein
MFKSCAEWPPEVFTDADGGNISTDLHHTEEEAASVARMLMRHSFGGQGRKPLRTLVEPADTPRLERCGFDDECEYCKNPDGGSYAKMIRVPMENAEVDFYICGRCASSRGWLPNAKAQPADQETPHGK